MFRCTGRKYADDWGKFVDVVGTDCRTSDRQSHTSVEGQQDKTDSDTEADQSTRRRGSIHRTTANTQHLHMLCYLPVNTGLILVERSYCIANWSYCRINMSSVVRLS